MNNVLRGKNIIIGITGGIAAYKTPQLVRLLKKSGANVRVALTDGATRFVSELALATVSEERVYRSIFPPADSSAARVLATSSSNSSARWAGGMRLGSDVGAALAKRKRAPNAALTSKGISW